MLDIAFSQKNLNELILEFTDLKSESVLDYCIDLSNDIIFKQGIVKNKLCFRVKYINNVIIKVYLLKFLMNY